MTPTERGPMAYTATITGTGPTTGHRVEIVIDPAAPGGPAAFIDCDGEVMLDADGVRRLAAACTQAADTLANVVG